MPNQKLPQKKKSSIKKEEGLEVIEQDILPDLSANKNSKYYRAVLGAALGSIPWVGSIYSVLIALQAESEQEQLNEMQKIWLYEHQEKIQELGSTLRDVILRLDEFSSTSEVEEMIVERIQSPEYLGLVRQTFRAWDEASTTEKRDKFKKLITNAAAIQLCTDDLVRLFIKWIQEYHEFHFQVMTEVYKSDDGITRGDIWDNLFGERPQENSAEAGFYKYLIRELSMGGVIIQHREVNVDGEYLKKPRRKSSSSTTMKSAFDDEERYELTELGLQFVHYVLEDVVPQIGDGENVE